MTESTPPKSAAATVQTVRFFETLLRASSDGILITDAAQNIVMANDAFCAILRRPRREIIETGLYDWLQELEYGAAHCWAELEKDVLAMGASHDVEFRIVTEEGIRHLSVNASRLEQVSAEEDGFILSMWRDVTARRQAEEEVTWQASVNSAVAELSRELLAQTSVEDISYLVLEHAKRLTGSRFGFAAHVDAETGFLIPSTFSRDIWDVCQVANKGLAFEKFSGMWGWVLENRTPMLTNAPQDDPRATGTPEGHIPIESFLAAPAVRGHTLIGIVALANSSRHYTDRDLALVEQLASVYGLAVQRQRSVDALREGEERHRRIVETANDGIWLTDSRDVTTFVNEKMAEMLGYRVDEMVGQPLFAFMTQEMAAIAGRYLQERRQALSGQHDLALRCRDGGAMWVIVSASPILGDDGEYQGTLAMLADITDRKHAEERLQRYASALQERNEEVRRFAFIVSHDLRAPLVNLKGFGAALRDSVDLIADTMDELMPHLTPEKQEELGIALYQDVPEALTYIDMSVDRMDRFVRAVLQLSRVGSRELVLEPVDMGELVRGALAALAHQLEQGRVTVSYGALPVVVADRTSLEQIMGNLLSNAVKYLDPQRPGEIEIGGEIVDGEIAYRVHDNGRGIAEEQWDQVFAPFRRAGHGNVPGEGIGLSYVQALVRRHGGRIWFESQHGVGTTFAFSLPLRPANPETYPL